MVIERLMRSLLIVENNIFCKNMTSLLNSIKAMQIYNFILDSAPQPFYINIICPSSFSIHTNKNLIFLKSAYPRFTCKLTTLIAINNVRLFTLQSGIEHL